jgi:hypothetical protein
MAAPRDRAVQLSATLTADGHLSGNLGSGTFDRSDGCSGTLDRHQATALTGCGVLRNHGTATSAMPSVSDPTCQTAYEDKDQHSRGASRPGFAKILSLWK